MPIPIENTTPAGFNDDYFFPAFIPIDIWKNMTVNSNDFNFFAANLCEASSVAVFVALYTTTLRVITTST